MGMEVRVWDVMENLTASISMTNVESVVATACLVIIHATLQTVHYVLQLKGAHGVQ